MDRFSTHGIYATIKFDGEEKLKVIPATDLCEKIEPIRAAFDKRESFSFINIGNKIQHCLIKFLGTEFDCNQYVIGAECAVSETSPSSIGSFSLHGLTSEEEESCQESPKVEEFTTDAKLVFLTRNIQEMKEKINTMETKIDFLIDNLVGKNTIGRSCKEKNEKHHLRAEFQSILDRKRSEKKWRDMIKELQLSSYDERKQKEIKNLLLNGTSESGIFIRKLARILFGEEKLEKNLMGIDGQKLKGFKDVDRQVLFSVREELELVEILKKIDSELFTSKEVFNNLVRSSINQCGRDIKKKNIQICGKTKPRMQQITSYFKPAQIPSTSRKNTQQEDVITIDVSLPRRETNFTQNR